MAKRLTPVQRLMAAMDRCACARGEAQWTNGYRSAKQDNTQEGFDKEQRKWRLVDDAEARFRRLAYRIVRSHHKSEGSAK